MASPGKPKPRKPAQHELDEFAERYETLALVYGDPVEAVFEIMSDNDHEPEVRLQAARLLVEHRYPKLKALDGAPPVGPQVAINITMVQPPKQTVIDVTPALPKLEAAAA
jgi:hypothetical protein